MEKISKNLFAELKEKIAGIKVKNQPSSKKYIEYLALSAAEQRELAEKIEELSEEALVEVVKIILKECPQAISDQINENSKIEILLSMMDRPTSKKIQELLSREVG